MISKNVQLNTLSYDKKFTKPNDLNNNQSDKRNNFNSYFSIEQLLKNKNNKIPNKPLNNNVNSFEILVDKENKLSKINYLHSNEYSFMENEKLSLINSNKKSDEINKRLQRIIDMIKEQRLRDFKKQNLRSNCCENKNSFTDFNAKFLRTSKSFNEKIDLKKTNEITKCKSLNELFISNDFEDDINIFKNKTKVQSSSSTKTNNCRKSLLTPNKINKTKFVASLNKSETFDYSEKLFNHDSQLNNFSSKTNQSIFTVNNKIMSVNKNNCKDCRENDKLLDHQNKIKNNSLDKKVNKIEKAYLSFSAQDLKNTPKNKCEKNQFDYDNLKTRLRLNELQSLKSSKPNRIPPPRSINNLGDLCIEPGHNVVFASTNSKNHLCSVKNLNEVSDLNLEKNFNNKDNKVNFEKTTCADIKNSRLGYESLNDKLNNNLSKKCYRPASLKHIICENNLEYETGTCVQLSKNFFHQYPALENLNFTSKRTLNEISDSNILFANEENTAKKAHAQSTSFSETRNKILTNSKKKFFTFSSRSTSALDTSLLNSEKNLNKRKFYQTKSNSLIKNFDEILNQCLIENSNNILIDIEKKNSSMLQLSGKENSIENDLILSESKPNCDKFNKAEEMSSCYDHSSGTEEDFENNQLLTVSSTATNSSTASSYLSNGSKQSSLCINKNFNKNKSNHISLYNAKEQSTIIQSQQQSPTNTSSSSSFLSIPAVNNVEEDSIDDGIHLNSVPETRPIRDYRSHEEFIYAMKEDLAEWLNSIYNLELNVNNFMDQIGTGVIICRHANNLIQQAKNFYIQSDVVNMFNDHSEHVNKNSSINQRRLSNCSVVSSLSNNGSNNELSSLPVNLILYNSSKDSLTQTHSFSNTVSTKTLRPSKSAQSTPHASPKHLGNLNRTNSSSTNSLSSPIKNSNKLNQALKSSTNNTQAKTRNFSGSRIPQMIHNSTSKRLNLHNQVNIKSKSCNESVKNKSLISSKSSFTENTNRKKSVASSVSSSNLIVNSKSFYTPQLVRNSRTSLTSLNLTNCKNFSLTSNKNLSYSSSAIFNNVDKNSNVVNDFSSNFSNRLSKNSKKYVPLTKTKLMFAGSNNVFATANQKSLNISVTNSYLTTDQNNDQKNNLTKNTSNNQKNYSGNKISTISNTNNSQQLSSTSLSQSNWTEHQKKLRNLADAELIVYRDNVKPQSWHSRDNVSNFITACRNTFKIRDCLLFETDDLVMRKNERSFVLCMLELARIGCNFGISAPLIIQLEQEIDKEIALEEQNQKNNESEVSEYQNATTSINSKDTDSAISSDCEPEEQSVEPPTQIVTNDLKSLHERVVELLSLCNCPSQYPMIKVADGKYRIGETKVLIFVRILRNHVMVRVGGGWDTLQQYLLRHDPCRCKSGHKYANQAKIAISTNNNPNNSFNTNRKLSCDSISSLASNYMSNGQSSINKSNVSKSKDDNLSIMVTYNRCSTNVQG